MKKITLFLSLSLLMLGFVGPLQAKDSVSESAIQSRMIERVHDVDALKKKGSLGENNKGFLEQRGMLKPDDVKIMSKENADRRALYGIVASRLGLTIAVVGEGRAESLRNASAPGVWLQAPDNTWYKKE
jgi:uncharacterized protein YdbL (DUF1318 family)